MADEADSPEGKEHPPSATELDAGYRPFPSFTDWSSEVRIEESTWESIKRGLEEARTQNDEDVLRRAVDRAVRMAAIDTGAIEGLYEVDRGFTFTVAVQSALWQAEIAAKGQEAQSLIEDQLRAYEMVLDLATRNTPLSESAIRQLHEVICASQTHYRARTPEGEWTLVELKKGQYKEHPNHVQRPDGSFHSYAPVLDTGPEMHRFIEEIGSETFQQAHPDLQAAYAHFAFVNIHPFADGNGRVARLLASIFLYRAVAVPLVIFADQRVPYFDALLKGDEGNVQPFASFMFDAGLESMSLVIENLYAAAAPSPTAAAVAIRELVTIRGITHFELDDLGDKVLRSVAEEFNKQIGSLLLPPGTTGSTGIVGHQTEPPPGYRFTSQHGPRALQMRLATSPPADSGTEWRFQLFYALDDDQPYSVLLVGIDNPTLVFGVRVPEMLPDFSTALGIRITTWVERALGLMAHQHAEATVIALQQKGYHT